MTTYPAIKAHIIAKVSVTWKMPGVSGTFTVAATAHATSAIGGKSRGTAAATSRARCCRTPPRCVFQPSERTGSLSCGDNITPAFFEAGEHTVQLRASMGCAHSKVAVKSPRVARHSIFRASRSSERRPTRSRAVWAFSSPPPTSRSSAAAPPRRAASSTSTMPHGRGRRRRVDGDDLRCSRARSAGIDITSDDVELDGLLIDLVVGGPRRRRRSPVGSACI